MSSRPAAPERLTFRLFRDLHDRPGNGNADIYWVDAGLVTSLRAKAVFAQGGTIHGAARAGDLATVRALIEKDVNWRSPGTKPAGPRCTWPPAAGARMSPPPGRARRRRQRRRQQRVDPAPCGRCGRPGRGGRPPDRAEGRPGCPHVRRARHLSRWRRAAARPAPSRACSHAGAATDAANAYGRTPLLLVARESGKADIARLLLDRKADVDAKDKFGDTPLTLAAWRGFREVVDLLLERGAAVPATGPAAERLLQSAADEGPRRLFTTMAGKGVDLSARTERGGTLLHDAAGGGSVGIVSELLARKFAVNDADRDGWTPLHNAAFMGRLDVVKALVGRRSRPERTQRPRSDCLEPGPRAWSRRRRGLARRERREPGCAEVPGAHRGLPGPGASRARFPRSSRPASSAVISACTAAPRSRRTAANSTGASRFRREAPDTAAAGR